MPGTLQKAMFRYTLVEMAFSVSGGNLYMTNGNARGVYQDDTEAVEQGFEHTFDLLCERLVKKLTVSGIIGNTQG